MAELGTVVALIKSMSGADPEVIEQAVQDWLDDHPEATTTVQDGSITEAKLAQDVLADLAEIDTLSEAIATENTELHGEPSINLYDTNDPDFLSGKYLDGSGNVVTNAQYNETGFIPCENGDKFTFTSSAGYLSSSRIVVYYDENKDYISGDTSAYMPTITINVATAKYFRISLEASAVNLMIVKNDTSIHDYVPAGVYPERITEYGGITKKIIDYDTDFYGDYSINVFNKNDPDMLYGKYIDKNGNEQTYLNYNETGFIPCESGDKFTFTRNGAYFTGSLVIVYYDANKNLVSGDNSAAMPTITAPAGAKYFRAPVTNNDLDIMMVTKNDTRQLPYVPYGRTGGVVSTTQDAKNAGLLHWKGKSAVLLGDSIMWADGHNDIVGYPHYIAELGFSIVTNNGVSGACVAYHSETHHTDICTTVDSVSFGNFDLVVIAGGVNDFDNATASPIGTLVNSATIGDFTKTDFIGALQYIITKILTVNPSIKIVLMTPLKKSGWYTANSQSKVLDDYVDAIKEVGEYYSIPVLDFFAESGINRMTFSTFLSDGLHPNNDGYLHMSERLKSFINSI